VHREEPQKTTNLRHDVLQSASAISPACIDDEALDTGLRQIDKPKRAIHCQLMLHQLACSHPMLLNGVRGEPPHVEQILTICIHSGSEWPVHWRLGDRQELLILEEALQAPDSRGYSP
jgi:hypothetical protein